jgi:hypothetical protein
MYNRNQLLRLRALKANSSSIKHIELSPDPKIEDRDSSPIQINNVKTKYTLHFGQDFKSMLEPRDQVLEHDFHFEVPINLEGGSELPDFLQLRQDIMSHYQSFLVETASNVVSIAFGMLSEDKLDEKEVKDYAAKNILLNINSLLKQTISGIKGHPLIDK